MRCVVTGGAGFIGSSLVDSLIEKGYEVVVIDNLHLGVKENVEYHLPNSKFSFLQLDLLDLDAIKGAFANADIVFHLAANSDISHGAKHTNVDLDLGTIATYNVLEAMRLNDVKKIVFASSSAIYGEPTQVPTNEFYGPLFPISLYGASKLAGEALISAFCHNFDMQAWIFRFANIIGERGSHGIGVDFIRKLRENPERLEILGDGLQAKPYLYVRECVDGILFGLENAKEQVNAFNLGCKGQTQVNMIANIVVEEMGLENVEFKYTGGSRGWKGDVPKVEYDTARMTALGWQPRLSSTDAVRAGIKGLLTGRKQSY